MTHGTKVAADEYGHRASGKAECVNRPRKLIAIVLCTVMLAAATPAYGISRVQALSFIDENTGYIGGWHPSLRGFVSYTNDGGASWNATSTGSWPVSSIAAGPAGALATLGEYSARPLVITTPGLKWNLGAQVHSNATPSQVIRLASGRLVAVGQIKNYTIGSNNYGQVAFVATSDDDGLSWTTRLAGPLYQPPSTDANPPLTWASIADVDATSDGSVLWAVGNELNASGSSVTYKGRLIYRSADGGSTWTTQTDSGMTRLNCVTVASNDVAYAFGDGRAALKTTNGGASWVSLSLPAFATAMGSSVNLEAADAVSATTLMVAGNRTISGPSQFVKSVDGGATWTLGPVFGPALFGVHALTDAHWIAVGSNETIIHTRDAGATWSPPAGEKPPVVALAQPAPEFIPSASPVVISGTANDGAGDSPGVGVERVEVRIKRADGRSWNGISWVDGDAWVRTSTADGWRNWAYSWSPDAAFLAAPSQVLLTARATDGIGLQILSRFDPSVPPVVSPPASPVVDPSTPPVVEAQRPRTKPTLGRPSLKTTNLVKGRTYSVSGTLKPRHAAGTKPVKVHAYRLVKGKYRYYKSFSATASNYSTYSKYTAKVKLPYRGRWRLRAYHPVDTKHLATYSTYRYVTVR